MEQVADDVYYVQAKRIMKNAEIVISFSTRPTNNEHGRLRTEHVITAETMMMINNDALFLRHW